MRKNEIYEKFEANGIICLNTLLNTPLSEKDSETLTNLEEIIQDLFSSAFLSKDSFETTTETQFIVSDYESKETYKMKTLERLQDFLEDYDSDTDLLDIYDLHHGGRKMTVKKQFIVE